MRVLKTIVATTVIVFTLTTVAMAGVHRFTQHDGATTQRLGATAPVGRPAHAPQTVTLTERQFDRMLSQMRSGNQWMRGNVAAGQRAAGWVATQPHMNYQGQAATQSQPPVQGSGYHGCYNYRACPGYGNQNGTGTSWQGGSSGSGGRGCW
jgi:hypothetical protein